jgi:uncharacterized protein
VRVVADANILVSATITPTGVPGQFFHRWRLSQFNLLLSEPILEEYQRALGYPHIQRLHQLSDEGITALIGRFRRYSHLTSPPRRLSVVVADPSDDKYIECAVAGEADYLVSGDTYLLALHQYAGIHILSPRAFLAVLAQGIG